MPSERLAHFLRYIAANVRGCRIKHGLTQEQLAEIAGIDLTFLQRIEGAKTNISIDTLVKIADALDVIPSLLLHPAQFRPHRPGRPRRR